MLWLQNERFVALAKGRNKRLESLSFKRNGKDSQEWGPWTLGELESSLRVRELSWHSLRLGELSIFLESSRQMRLGQALSNHAFTVVFWPWIHLPFLESWQSQNVITFYRLIMAGTPSWFKWLSMFLFAQICEEVFMIFFLLCQFKFVSLSCTLFSAFSVCLPLNVSVHWLLD